MECALLIYKNMTSKNEEKAQEIANDKKIISLNKFGRLDIEATKWMSALEAMEWKDKQFAEENKWISVEDELPPFITTEDGSQYSKPVLCKEKCGSYCVARFVHWQTGHSMWLDSSDEQMNVKFWKEIKD